MTSLAAQWLHHCGLHMGDDLYGAGIGNVKGHYEDKDFINLHDHVLKNNNSHWRNSSSQKFEFDKYSVEKSKMLVRLKSGLYGQWGWKDPRTCLFLDHWNDIVPNARYLIVYRPFTEVVDSFLRREFKVKNRVEYILEMRKYVSKFLNYNRKKEDNLRLWMHYNSSILDFLERVSMERCVVLRNDQLLQNSDLVFKKITESWGFDLDYVPVKSIFDAEITKKAPADLLKGVDNRLVEKASEIEGQLAAYSES
jgi:hypothetical protein